MSAFDELEFRDPPPKNGGRGRAIGPLLDQLRQQPGRWAAIGKYPTVTTATSRAWQLRKIHLDIEFRSAGLEVFARARSKAGE